MSRLTINLKCYKLSFLIKNEVPEVQEASKNLPGARGFVFPKYQPVAIHGDPIHPQITSFFRTCTSQITHFPKLDLNVPPT